MCAVFPLLGPHPKGGSAFTRSWRGPARLWTVENPLLRLVYSSSKFPASASRTAARMSDDRYIAPPPAS